MSPVIEFERVTKAYRLGTGQQSLREAVSAVPRRLLGRGSDDTENDRVIQAVNDVSFTVEPGTTLGIIGRNGAGKTTILKLLSGVTRPTTGRIHTAGRLSALIELGAGFHPDLTGRENVYLNGAILGLSKREIDRKYDAIVAFAELEPFMNTPVKRYSSGMYARLGFAVAAHVEPDLLLVDEVLSVGDASFQRKCFNFIHGFVHSGHTTVFVSHNMYALEQLCDRVLWIDRGRVIQYGPSAEVLPAYLRADEERLKQITPEKSEAGNDLRIERVYTTDGQDRPRSDFNSGEDIVVHVAYATNLPVECPHFVLAVWDVATSQSIFIASMLIDGSAPSLLEGSGVLSCHFSAPPLMPRTYQIWGEVWASDRQEVLVKWQPLAAFSIENAPDTRAGTGSVRHERADAPVRVPYQWLVKPLL